MVEKRFLPIGALLYWNGTTSAFLDANVSERVVGIPDTIS
jgi:hypothetical protein